MASHSQHNHHRGRVHIGTKVSKLCAVLGRTQEWLAAKIGVPRTTIRNWQHPDCSMTNYSTFSKLLRAFGFRDVDHFNMSYEINFADIDLKTFKIYNIESKDSVLNKLHSDLDGSVMHDIPFSEEARCRVRSLIAERKAWNHVDNFEIISLNSFSELNKLSLIYNDGSISISKYQELLDKDLRGRQLRVCCDCITVGCLATSLSMAEKQTVNIDLDHQHTYGKEQVKTINSDDGPDVLITVDGSFALAEATFYKRAIAVHYENQGCIVLPGACQQPPPYIFYLGDCSPHEQIIFNKFYQAFVHYRANDFCEFIDQFLKMARGGDYIVGWQPLIATLVRRWAGNSEKFPGDATDFYRNAVSINIHRRWCKNDVSEWVIHFIRLFAAEWRHLWFNRKRAETILNSDNKGAGYIARDFFEHAELAFGFRNI